MARDWGPPCPPRQFPADCACEAGGGMEWDEFPFRRVFEWCRKCRANATVFAYGARKDSGGAMWGKYRDEAGHEQELPLKVQDYEALLPLAAQEEGDRG